VTEFVSGRSPSTAELRSWQRLRELRAMGSLVTNYSEVPTLLANLGDEYLRRASHLLSRLSVSEITSRYQQYAAVRVYLTGNFTISPLVDLLTVVMARHGIVLDAEVGDYNQYLFDFNDDESRLYAKRFDLTCCILDPHVVFDPLRAPWSIAQVEKQFTDVLQQLRKIADWHERKGSGTLVLNSIPLPRYFAFQMRDYRSRMRLGAAWRELNAQILRIGNESDRRTMVVDLDILLTGSAALADARSSIYAKAHFSEDLLMAYAREVAHVFRAVSGQTKKCLVLDLDGTLWGGTLAEDGWEGLQVGDTGTGAAFAEFQWLVRQIGAQGVMLAICSKNDKNAVVHVLRNRSDMALQEKDFVAIRANWEPKPFNLVDIAKELNISLDSMVLVDDNSFECELVRKMLPEVQVIEVDNEPALHGERLLEDGWFTTVELTDEDLSRNESYRSEAQRRARQCEFLSIEDYLRDLEMTVRIFRPAEASLPRISQLTQRTNQFNLTGVRMGVEEIRQYVARDDHFVLGVQSSDKFGDSGLVGALLAGIKGELLNIDHFLLSCRVFSRGIESACILALLQYANRTGLRGVRGCYRQTNKNQRFADFYLRHGFGAAGEQQGVQYYLHDLHESPPAVDHITLAASF